MKSTLFKEYERSSEPAKRSYPLIDIIGTNQNPYWHTRHDSKTDRVKGSPGGTKPHHTTPRAGDHERED